MTTRNLPPFPLPTNCPLPATPAELLERCVFCWARPGTRKLRSLCGMTYKACAPCFASYPKRAEAWVLRPVDEPAETEGGK